MELEGGEELKEELPTGPGMAGDFPGALLRMMREETFRPVTGLLADERESRSETERERETGNERETKTETGTEKGKEVR